METSCKRCGAPSDDGRIVCAFCGAQIREADSEADELRALDELNAVADQIGRAVGDNRGGLLAIYTTVGDAVKRADKLGAFWQTAFVPRHPKAQLRAFHESLQRITSQQQDMMSAAMLARVESILSAFRLNAAQEPSLYALVPQLEREVSRARHRSRSVLYWMGGAIVGMFLLMAVIALSAAPSTEGRCRDWSNRDTRLAACIESCSSGIKWACEMADTMRRDSSAAPKSSASVLPANKAVDDE
ncbi:hypothetical protein [Gemmatimonas sp.]|uniref:hypothetical protein n=1 Tax=Gemmatimonas sp. TaxID=1962908 RepID=UPI0039831881